ncbi:F-box/WD repeat-containing protein 10 [Sphaeramia orbicularis]|uniref:F-box/WD repeat-containing protein 10 n=1 Tax=Sphaeramia orbicularis TaxID=375764 RepID=UPI00117C62A4|nr:CMT1A duplicated region transcript 1 protein [Sphaeramia orbicularis]
MRSVKFSRSVSASAEHPGAEGCAGMCGMCPSCAFAPKPPGSSQYLWRISDGFQRRFLVDLLLRCRSVRVLESVQRTLNVTSWTLFTYARSRSPACPQQQSPRDPDGKPHGVNVHGIWDWFSNCPDWMKSRYLCSLFLLCDSELLRMLGNLTSVLLVQQKRGFLQFNVETCDANDEENSEDPALMVVLGSSKSVSGVSGYRDFIGCLPVDLAKRILGLLDEHSLRCCLKVCQYWQLLAKETMEEIKFRRIFDQKVNMMIKNKDVNIVSPTYANIVEVLVPIEDADVSWNREDIHSSTHKAKSFKTACADVKTKAVKMEERNVYCGAYFTTVLLNKEDPYRVVDYGGKSFMSVGSKDKAVHLLYVASETKNIAVLKGHVGSIRAVLICEDRDLVISAGCDAIIRCWNLRTDKCVMALYGHSGVVYCLDVHDDRLVSGAKDCTVKVWSLLTGKRCEDYNFKHHSSVRCVKINTTKVYSSCDRGFIKIWDMENASLLRVIDAHRSSVKCLFFNEWYLLSGDSNGQVMAWSINCDTKENLITFNHPKEVKSLTLTYLRVVTGCADGKIRIFNFLTGDCLREITAETEAGRILSLHFHENSILVNSSSSVKLYQFGKVYWDYMESTDTRLKDHTTQVALPSDKMHDCNDGKSDRSDLLYQTHLPSASTKCQAAERYEMVKRSLLLSERATSERIKKRGPHHPLTRDSIVLRVNAIQKAQCTDEVSINMELNARLRDSWGPHTPQVQSNIQGLELKCPRRHAHDDHAKRAKTSSAGLKRAVGLRRAVSTAPDRMMRHSLMSEESKPHTVDSQRKVTSAFTRSAKAEPHAPEHIMVRSLPNLECCVKTTAGLPKISPVDPFKERTEFRLFTATQQEDYVRTMREHMQNWEKKPSKREKDKKIL